MMDGDEVVTKVVTDVKRSSLMPHINAYVGKYGATVNGMEGFCSQLKRSINGTHIHVSGKHLWKYAKEAEYRFNRRDCASSMLPELLSTFRPLPPKCD